MSDLPTLDDLASPDRDCVPIRPDGVLDLERWVGLNALLRTLARQVGLDPEPGVVWTRALPYGWRLSSGSTAVLFSGLAGVQARFVVPQVQHEPDTPSGRRRAAVRAWRVVRAAR
jgi:hypothetical protein